MRDFGYAGARRSIRVADVFANRIALGREMLEQETMP
jgi:hypothetical protein